MSIPPQLLRLGSSYVATELTLLVRGQAMMKVKSVAKTNMKFVMLAEDHMSFSYSPLRGFACQNNGKTIQIQDIKEIRKGWKTDRFIKIRKAIGNKKKKKKEFAENLCFSIIVGSKHKTIDFVAKDPSSQEMWVKVLQFLVRRSKHVELSRHHEAWIRGHYEKADVNADGKLNLEECSQLLKNMNVQLPKRYVKSMFNTANVKRNLRGEESLDKEEFVHFYKILSVRHDIADILHRYLVATNNWFSEDGDLFLNANELRKFYLVKQKKKVSLEECCDLIEKYETSEENKREGLMSVEGFSALLQGKHHRLFNPEYLKIYQDMTQPLTNYYIASSHNTYLMSDQLSGASSCEAYRRALQQGCRCVEIDVWDGSEGEPLVYHGHTLTSRILFKDVLVTCRRYAFVASSYPVILSLENHCSVGQQHVMAKHFRDIMGDVLHVPDVNKIEDVLPSPEELKGKILIKGKRLPEEISSKVEEEEVSDEDEAAEMKEDADLTIVTTPPASSAASPVESPSASPEFTRAKGKKMEVESEVTDEGKESATKKEKSSKKKKKKIKLSKDLSDLVFLKSVHFSNFNHSEQTYRAYEMSSLGEKKAMKLSAAEARAFVSHSQIFLSRIYPAGKRTDSSNYDPVPLWNVGAQIVALNYQTPGKAMQYNDGKFRDNGGCGYVLRPSYINTLSSQFDPNILPTPSGTGTRLDLTVISGQQLPKVSYDHKGEVIDPYVKVYIKGLPCDDQVWSTNYIHNNGFNPVWNEKHEFHIHAPELALIRFVIMDKDFSSHDDFIAQYVLPVSCVQPGYQHTYLYNKAGGRVFPASLFLHTRWLCHEPTRGQSTTSIFSTNQSAPTDKTTNQSSLLYDTANQSPQSNNTTHQSPQTNNTTNQSAPTNNTTNQSPQSNNTTNQSAPTNNTTNQSTPTNNTTNQSTPTINIINQSSLTYATANQLARSNGTSKQSSLTYASANQSPQSDTAGNYATDNPSALSNNTSNQSALCNMTASQSAANDMTIRQSAPAL